MGEVLGGVCDVEHSMNEEKIHRYGVRAAGGPWAPPSQEQLLGLVQEVWSLGPCVHRGLATPCPRHSLGIPRQTLTNKLG